MLVEKLEVADGNVNGTAAVEKQCGVPQKVKHRTNFIQICPKMYKQKQHYNSEI